MVKNKFLSQLFYEASAENGSPCDARKLNQFYERIPATQAAWDPIEDLFPDLDVEKLSAVESAVSELADAFERQGFINGFRMGMMLRGELDVSNLDTGKEHTVNAG